MLANRRPTPGDFASTFLVDKLEPNPELVRSHVRCGLRSKLRCGDADCDEVYLAAIVDGERSKAVGFKGASLELFEVADRAAPCMNSLAGFTGLPLSGDLSLGFPLILLTSLGGETLCERVPAASAAYRAPDVGVAVAGERLVVVLADCGRNAEVAPWSAADGFLEEVEGFGFLRKRGFVAGT